jgi:hypothetical protein
MAFKLKGWSAGENTGSAYKNVSKTKYGEASAAFQYVPPRPSEKEKSPVARYNELKNKKNKTKEEEQELDNLMKKLDKMYDDQYEDDDRDLYNQLNPRNPEKD